MFSTQKIIISRNVKFSEEQSWQQNDNNQDEITLDLKLTDGVVPAEEDKEADANEIRDAAIEIGNEGEVDTGQHMIIHLEGSDH